MRIIQDRRATTDVGSWPSARHWVQIFYLGNASPWPWALCLSFDTLRVSQWHGGTQHLCQTLKVHSFLVNHLVVFTSALTPWLQLFFPWFGWHSRRAVRDHQHLLPGNMNTCVASCVYTCTYMHVLRVLYRIMKTFGFITVSSSTIYHTDSPLRLRQSNFLEFRKHPYLLHLVYPKNGTPSIPSTWQVLTVYCLTGNELNYTFYLCLTVLWNLKEAGTPQILLPCQC